MKKLYLILAALLLVASCKKKDDIQVPVRIHVNDFTITQDTLPSKDGIPEYNGIKAVTLAFYKTSDGSEQYKETQLRADPSNYTTFGDFSLSLPMGSYTMVVLGYGLKDGEPAITLTSPTSATFGDHPVRETFAATQSVNITNTNAVEISATLSRVIARLQISSTDPRTENAVASRVTFSAGGKSFDPSTGLATTNTGFVNEVVLGAAVGEIAGTLNYVFLNTDEQTMTITIDILDGDGNAVYHRVVNDVPLQRNRKTKLTGSLFSTESSTDFEIDTEWIQTEIVIPL